MRKVVAMSLWPIRNAGYYRSPDEAVEMLAPMHHIKFQRKAHSHTGAWFGFGNMTVTFRLPGGLIQTRVIGSNWTALD